jgi:AcrR family transcriptional regulator
MTPRQQRGEDRRAAILDVADRLFRRQGYAATSMRQIAAEAGFGRAVSGLYNHYPNKEAIFAALLTTRSPYEPLLDALRLVEGQTLEDFLRNWLRTVWPVLVEYLDYLQLVFIDLQEFDGQTLATFLKDLLPHYFMVFSQVRQLPGVRQDLSLTVLIRTIATVMIGSLLTEVMIQRGAVDGLPEPIAVGDEWIDGLANILARGMSDSPAATKSDAT